MKCNQCGAEAPAGAAFCPKCGAQLTAAARMQSGGAQASARDVPESDLWSGSYSPKAMLGWYVLIGLLAIVGIVVTSLTGIGTIAVVGIAGAAVVIAAALAIKALYKQKSMSYRLTTHRLVLEQGILSRTDDRIMLVDIDDISVQQSMMGRILNLGTITLFTSDETTMEKEGRTKDDKGELVMDGIENPRQVGDLIDETRRAERTRRGMYMMNA